MSPSTTSAAMGRNDALREPPAAVCPHNVRTHAADPSVGGAFWVRLPWLPRRPGAVIRRGSRTDRASPVAFDVRRSDALHVFGDTFRALAEKATGGAVTIRVFPSGTLGQEREVVQQLQEGLVDFMVSGTAIWGSVAPKLQVFDFPFLWRDWDHVHRIVDGRVGLDAADYLEKTVRMRPLAWGDSFGFRQVVTRSRDVIEAAQLAGLKIRTIQSSIYVKADRADGRQPDAHGIRRGLYVSADRRDRRLRARCEHDRAAAFLRGGSSHGADASHRRRDWTVRVVCAVSHGLPRTSAARLKRAALEASAAQREVGPREDAAATEQLTGLGMTIRDIDGRAFRRPRRTAVGIGGPRARRAGVARRHPRMSHCDSGSAGTAHWTDRAARSVPSRRSSSRRPLSSVCR